MDNEKKILEILDIIIPEFSYKVAKYLNSREIKFKLAKEINDLFKDYYSAEFVELMSKEVFYDDCLKEYHYYIDVNEYLTFKTLPELYQYWKSNIKGK